MGMISQFGPIRFNQTAGGNYEVTSHAENSATLGLKSSFVQEFKDNAETIYFVDAISGVYGFSSVSQFNNSSGVNLRIDSCKFCADSGKVVYTNLDGAVVGKRLVAKFDGVVDIEIRENTSVIHTFNSVSGQFDYILDQNFTNLTITFNSTSEYCIYGIMLCEPFVEYSFCGFDLEAELIGISPFGGAYLITSDIQWYELNNVVAEQLNVYSLDFTNKTNFIGPNINFRIKIGTTDIYRFAELSGISSDLELLNEFKNNTFNWIETEVNSLTLSVTLPAICGAVVLEVYNDNTLDSTFAFNLDETIVDDNYLYTNNDSNIDAIEGLDIIIDSFGSLPRTNEEYIAADGIVGIPVTLQTDVYYETNGIPIDWTDESAEFSSSSYIQISKIGRVLGSCCVFVVEDLTSEPVSIVQETDKRLIQYLDTQFRQGLLANFEHKLWLDCNLRRTAGSQTNSFVGEKRDYILKGRVSLNRELQTKEAIPDYLCEILEGALNCDSFKIDGILYAKTDEPAFEYVDDNVLLCEFSAEIRKSE